MIDAMEINMLIILIIVYSFLTICVIIIFSSIIYYLFLRYRHNKRKRMVNDKCLECSICLDLISKDIIIYKLECNHKFHQTCINKWTMINNSCPLCRIYLKC